MDKQHKPSQVVLGQKVTEDQVLLARALRRSMTPAEKVLWERLRSNRLGGFHFRRQQIIDGFIVDFYCHRAALAVEVDGSTHDREYDQERDAILAGKGIMVLRFWNDEALKDTDWVLERISSCVEGRGNRQT